MWPGFDGRAYTREQWVAHVAQTDLFPGCNGIVQHATGIPTLAQSLGLNEEAYARNTQTYYQNQLGWAHGPHGFATFKDILGFSALNCRGTHDSEENYQKLGFEGMGNRNTENFSTGPGAAMLENQHFMMAVCFVKLKLAPSFTTYVPHSRCKRDGHFQCPHENWEAQFRASETAAIVAFMNTLGDKLPVNAPLAAQATPIFSANMGPLEGSVAWCQAALNAAGAAPQIKVDNDNGPNTRAAAEAFQAKAHLDVDGIIGPKTIAALKFYAPKTIALAA